MPLPPEVQSLQATLAQLPGLYAIVSHIEALEGLTNDDLALVEFGHLPHAALRRTNGGLPAEQLVQLEFSLEANAAAWLAEPNVVAVGGSWLCPAADIRSGNWAGISAICDLAMKLLKPA